MELFDSGPGNDYGDRTEKKVSKHFVPPDGGWGYAVCAGVGITFMLGFGSSSAFGILFNNFFAEKGGASGLTLVIGVYNGALSISGFLSGLALRKYTLRQVGLCGAVLFVLGDFLTIFVTTTFHLALTFGVVRGTGFGVMIPVSYTAFNKYFTSKRASMMSASQTLSSVASMTFPVLVTFCLQQYGFRGSLLIVSAVDLHLIVAMLVMHPVEWHLVPGPVDLGLLGQAAEVAYRIEEDLMLNAKKVGRKQLYSPVSQDADVKNRVVTVCGKLEKYFDVGLMTDSGFWILMVGVGFAFVSDVTYLALEPMLLFSYGYRDVEVAFCVMVGAAADLGSRLLMAVYSNFISMNHRFTYFLGAGLTVLLRTVFLQRTDLFYVSIMTGVLGLVRCFVQVLFPLVIADYVTTDKFSSALSIYILFSGILLMSAEPFIGLIYELSKSYVICFHALSFCSMICVLVWGGEYIVNNKCKLRTAD